jgi:hypothetical protein
MDHNQPSARHQARHRPAVRIQSSQPIEPHFRPALPDQPGPTIRPGQCDLGRSHDRCWIPLCFVLVLAEEAKHEEVEVDR